jgi:hypothetical protein
MFMLPITVRFKAKGQSFKVENLWFQDGFSILQCKILLRNIAA